ncbi:hypothetical protein, partial [Agrobacterium tumefaciens]|uniref:hypothetical protein n=1 Tax=Agrobacterium tumefaciens TaxID=358 RepID=UPI001AEBE371
VKKTIKGLRGNSEPFLHSMWLLATSIALPTSTVNSIFGIAMHHKTVMMHNHSTSDKNRRDR